MHHEPEAGTPAAPSEASTTATGGAGLFGHASRDPFPRWAGWAAGIAALAFTAAVAVALYVLNPAFQSGRAGGTPDQLGQPVAAGGGPELAAGSPAAAGRALLAQKGCGGCHVIPGVPGAAGTVGPSLAGIAGRTTIAGGAVPVRSPDDLKRWILNPAALKPGTAMPNLGLSDDEATKIVAYLETLK